MCSCWTRWRIMWRTSTRSAKSKCKCMGKKKWSNADLMIDRTVDSPQPPCTSCALPRKFYDEKPFHRNVQIFTNFRSCRTRFRGQSRSLSGRHRKHRSGATSNQQAPTLKHVRQHGVRLMPREVFDDFATAEQTHTCGCRSWKNLKIFLHTCHTGLYVNVSRANDSRILATAVNTQRDRKNIRTLRVCNTREISPTSDDGTNAQTIKKKNRRTKTVFIVASLSPAYNQWYQ